MTETRTHLRFLVCGSVDDGKSTLIGRLLYDTEQVFDDQISALERDSRAHGTTGGHVDFALLLDGLKAEREQGITIDVAHRYFATKKRSFIVADTPGHEQYTRNMATGASECDLAVLLVDARKGLLTQTRRHSFIVHLLGIRHVVVAVNKMDLIDYDESRYNEIVESYRAFAANLGIPHVAAIPVSSRLGENVARRASTMPWYGGPTLLSFLETVEIKTSSQGSPMRYPVQLVSRPSADFRGFAGTIAAGEIRSGDRIVALPSAREAYVSRIATFDGDKASAGAGEAVTLVLDREIDVSRGDVLVGFADRPQVADQVSADIIWMGDEPMLAGRPYLIEIATQQASATVTALKHKVNVDTFEHIAGRQLGLNEIGLCNLSFSRPLVFEAYEKSRTLGAFILVDKITNATVAAGMIRFALRRADNIQWQALAVDCAARAAQKHQRPRCLWFTGLSGSGKSTTANLLEKRLHALGRHSYLLDGDNVRHGLNRDLGFTDADRVENIRRVAEVARLMVDAGLIVIVSFISPFQAERRMARELFNEGDFVEIFVDTPLQVCESRDPKGLYARARRGEIKNFTGIDSAYEAPEHPELRLDTTAHAPEELVEQVLARLLEDERELRLPR